MLQDVDQERWDKAENELDGKLQKHVNVYNESHRLLKALKKNNNKYYEKIADVNANAKDISTEKESWDIFVLCQKELEKEVSELTNKVVPTFGIYFECDKK